MKKIILLCFLGFSFLLAGCAQKGIKDNYKQFRGLTAEQLYEHTQISLRKGNYSDAVKYVEASDALYPFGPYAEQIQLDSIYAYYKRGDDDMALAATDRYLRLYPRGQSADYVYYLKGLVTYGHGFTWLQRKFGSDPATRDLSDKKIAFQAFSDLVTYYPNSPFVHDALLHMAYIRNLIAKEYVVIADYYYRRKAYVAAANRASEVVSHYEGSPEVIPALQILIKSYHALGLDEKAGAAQQILQANYAALRVK